MKNCFQFALLLSTMSFALSASADVQRFCSRYEERMREVNLAKSQNGFITLGVADEGRPSNGELYYGCGILQNDWRAALYKKVCEGKSNITVRLPKVQLFFFDGFGDFDTTAGNMIGAVNLTESKGEGLSSGRGNGIGILMRTTLASLKNRQDLDLFYYGGSGLEEKFSRNMALACQKELMVDIDLAKNILPELDTPKLVISGYSNGGIEAINLTNDLNELNAKVDLLLTVDPVAHATKLMLKKSGAKDYTLTRPANAERAVNMYQQVDRNSMPFITLRGTEVVNADENHNMMPKFEEYTSKYHIYILMDDTVRAKYKCELSKILNNTNC